MNLENTKVYTTDKEVIRKYAALCGLPLYMDHEIYVSPVGYAEKGSIVTCFVKFSIDDTCRIRRTITPEQINALYDERFSEVIATETPEEAEAFSAIQAQDATSDDCKVEIAFHSNQDNGIKPPSWAVHGIGDEVEKIKGSSWKGKVVGYYSTYLTPKGYAVESSREKGSVQIYPESALRSVETKFERKKRERLEAPNSSDWKNGDECTYDGSKYIFVGMTPTFNDVSCIIFDHKNGIEHVSVNKLRKETPEQREDRKRLEAAIDLRDVFNAENCKDTPNIIKKFNWESCPQRVKNGYLAIVDKTGYRKQQ